MNTTESRTPKTSIQVSLTRRQVRSVFAAINTAAMLSAGRIQRRDESQDMALAALISTMERASGVLLEEVDEWLLD
jgi:hypothetical protein